MKKLAVAATTDKNTAKTIGGIVLGAVFVMLIPILAIIAIFQGGAQLDFSALAAQAQSEQLAYFESAMLAIEDEITAQDLKVDPLRAQVILSLRPAGQGTGGGLLPTVYLMFCRESRCLFGRKRGLRRDIHGGRHRQD